MLKFLFTTIKVYPMTTPASELWKCEKGLQNFLQTKNNIDTLSLNCSTIGGAHVLFTAP